ncbi:hypothetical protein C9426_24120 [Serratia sp. S1B]|nr:hypothetical protein C9426_24120 [Serratia sp. S1B]
MFNKTNVENKTINAHPYSPDNLRLIIDGKKEEFIFQLECIVSVEPHFSQKNYCCVNLSDGNKQWVLLSASELFNQLKLPQDKP